jgi:hypothetical protein
MLLTFASNVQVINFTERRLVRYMCCLLFLHGVVRG